MIPTDHIGEIRLMVWRRRLLLFVTSVLTMLGGCSYFNRQLYLPDDHPLEQYIEDQIESRTGVSIDFTPDPDCDH